VVVISVMFLYKKCIIVDVLYKETLMISMIQM
jgi:hypothetical protein